MLGAPCISYGHGQRQQKKQPLTDSVHTHTHALARVGLALPSELPHVFRAAVIEDFDTQFKSATFESNYDTGRLTVTAWHTVHLQACLLMPTSPQYSSPISLALLAPVQEKSLLMS